MIFWIIPGCVAADMLVEMSHYCLIFTGMGGRWSRWPLYACLTGVSPTSDFSLHLTLVVFVKGPQQHLYRL